MCYYIDSYTSLSETNSRKLKNFILRSSDTEVLSLLSSVCKNRRKEDSLNKSTENLQEFMSPAVLTALGLYIAMPGTFEFTAFLLYSAYKLYRRYMTGAGQFCRKLKMDETLCILKYRLKALDLQIKQLQTGISGCSKSKNPEKCKKIIDTKISKLTTKKEKINIKIKKRSTELRQKLGWKKYLPSFLRRNKTK